MQYVTGPKILQLQIWPELWKRNIFLAEAFKSTAQLNFADHDKYGNGLLIEA